MARGATAAVRDRRIDALKGFAIVCVVCYHAAGQYFSWTPANGIAYYDWAVWLRAFLFSFMLPLFAFLSGYMVGRPGGFKPREYFWKRSLGLLVPYFAWETVYGPGADKHPEMLSSVGAFLAYYGHLILDPHYEGRMWYLYVLWIALMALGLVRLVRDSTWALFASIPVVYVLGSFGQFHWLRWIYVFVVAGVLWRRYESAIVPRLAALGVAGALLYVPLWLSGQPEAVASQRFASWFGTSSAAVFASQQLVVLLPIAAGLCATAAILAVSYHIPRPAEASLAYLGVLSLGIYVTHFYFVEMWHAMPAWFLPVNAALALIVAAGATLVLGAWRVSALVFLGERWPGVSRRFGDVQTETL